jgi:hypothetical protein
MEYLVKSFDGHETKVEKASTFEDAKAKMQRAYKAALASADDKDEAEAAVYEDGELRYWLPASGRPVNLSVLRLSAICDRELQRVGLGVEDGQTVVTFYGKDPMSGRWNLIRVQKFSEHDEAVEMADRWVAKGKSYGAKVVFPDGETEKIGM